MPQPTLDATVAGPAANSYLDRTTADTLLAVRPGGAPGWTAAGSSPRDLALMQATAILERESYVGVRATPDQRLQWPRLGIDGALEALDPDAIPFGVQQATAELAERILAGTAMPTTPTGLAALAGSVKAITAGPVKLDLIATNAPSAEVPGSTLPIEVRQWVARYLRVALPPVVAVLPSSLAVVRSS